MKKLIIIILFIFLLACQKSEKLSLSSKLIDDASIKSYDLINEQVTTVHSMEASKAKKLVGVLESIDFKAVDFFQGFGSDQIYSIEFQPYYEGSFIFTKNLIVTHEGKIFSYDDDRLIKILEEYFEDDTYIDPLTWFVNQRYISIVNEEWFPEYLIEYDGHKETSLDVSMSLNIDHDTHEMMITIENRDEVKVDTGLAYDLDVNLDGKWYNISNVGKNNITMAFDALGFTIFPNMNQDFNHDLDHILPLPPGQYRVRKNISYGDKIRYVSQEFLISND